MIRRSRLPKMLLLLAAFVFFSTNTVYFLERPEGPLLAAGGTRVQFDFSELPEKKPYLNLKSAILVNYNNGQVLYDKKSDELRPIASITKLMMAMCLLDKKVDLKKTARISREDAYRSSRSRLRVGYELTLEDLLYAALLNSDNRAARALARAASGSIEAFCKRDELQGEIIGLGQHHIC